MRSDSTLAVIGTIEELSQSPRAQGIVRDQFETNFFGPVNIIKAILPTFRARKQGHILLLTAISEATSSVCNEHHTHNALQLVT